METRSPAPLGLQREPLVTPEIAEAARAALNYNPRVPVLQQADQGALREMRGLPFKQAQEPAEFGDVKSLLDFRRTRLDEERRLYRDVIGLSEDEAAQLQDRLVREVSLKQFEASLSPEKRARMEWFFEQSAFNRRGGPFKSWETIRGYDPESTAAEQDPAQLFGTLVKAVASGTLERAVNNDKFLAATIAARRFAELGG